jgi:hypothetical protein
MTQEQLDGAQIGAPLQHVRREAVRQSMRADALGETRADRRFMTRVSHRFVGDRLFLFRGFFAGRERVNARLSAARLCSAIVPRASFFSCKRCS